MLTNISTKKSGSTCCSVCARLHRDCYFCESRYFQQKVKENLFWLPLNYSYGKECPCDKFYNHSYIYMVGDRSTTPPWDISESQVGTVLYNDLDNHKH